MTSQRTEQRNFSSEGPLKNLPTYTRLAKMQKNLEKISVATLPLKLDRSLRLASWYDEIEFLAEHYDKRPLTQSTRRKTRNDSGLFGFIKYMVVRLIFIVHGCLAYYRVTGKYIFVLFNSHSLTITWPWPKPIRICLTVTVRDDLTPHGARWQCTAKTFCYGVFDAYRLKMTWIVYL